MRRRQHGCPAAQRPQPQDDALAHKSQLRNRILGHCPFPLQKPLHTARPIVKTPAFQKNSRVVRFRAVDIQTKRYLKRRAACLADLKNAADTGEFGQLQIEATGGRSRRRRRRQAPRCHDNLAGFGHGFKNDLVAFGAWAVRVFCYSRNVIVMAGVLLWGIVAVVIAAAVTGSVLGVV